MNTDDFWTLIERLQPLEHGSELSAALWGLSSDEIGEFQQHLVSAAQELNTSAHQSQRVVDEAAGDLGASIPLGDDAFLAARLAVVGGGRQVWVDVVADPSRFAGRWDLSLGEDLLAAVDHAFEQATGEPAPPVNEDRPRDQTQTLPPLPRRDWLYVFPAEHLGTRRLKLPKAYKGQLLHLQQLLNSDRSWWDWWEKTRGGPSQLTCHIGYHDQDQVRSSLRRGSDFAGEDEVTVQVVVPLIPTGSSPLSGEDEADHVQLARQHLNLLLDVVRKKLKAEPPSLLDQDLDRMEVARREQQRTRDRARHRS